MRHHYFRFRQFTVFQDKCAMKVCTDSCLFGAITAQKTETEKIAPQSILDIGGGTGLLSLMLAQKSDANIDAVEIEDNAAQQMKTNFAASPWSTRLHAFHEDIIEFKNPREYDFIISNPPFYQNQLRSNSIQKNIAKHDGGLTLVQLFESIYRLLSAKGNFAVMLPYFMKKRVQNIIAEKGLNISSVTSVRHSASHPFFRVIITGNKERTKKDIMEKSFSIYSGTTYSDELRLLLKDYYL